MKMIAVAGALTILLAACTTAQAPAPTGHLRADGHSHPAADLDSRPHGDPRPDGHSHPDADAGSDVDSRPDVDAGSHVDAYAYARAHMDSSAYADAGSHEHADADAYAYSYVHAHADAYAYSRVVRRAAPLQAGGARRPSVRLHQRRKDPACLVHFRGMLRRQRHSNRVGDKRLQPMAGALPGVSLSPRTAQRPAGVGLTSGNGDAAWGWGTEARLRPSAVPSPAAFAASSPLVGDLCITYLNRAQ